jgi:hypothetical protein
MLAFAVSIIGLSRADFEWMLPVEYVECVEAWQEEEQRKEKQAYELERFNIWLQHGKANSAPNSICSFPWEKKKVTGKIVSNGKTDAISKT